MGESICERYSYKIIATRRLGKKVWKKGKKAGWLTAQGGLGGYSKEYCKM